tara:strand:- start:492 stop:1562 length:1071 start_codon:yes stop_codon:yes gene_type:complete
MALQSSGQISLNDIHVELGESSGTEVSLNDSDVLGLISFSSGSEIELADFYGASSAVTLTSAGTVNGLAQRQEITASNFITAGQTLLIPSNLWVWSDNVNTAALTIDITCTIINQGVIMGRGGNGGRAIYNNHQAPEDGGSAIKINSGVTGVTILNSGGYIFGGGGGGGTGVSNGFSGGGGGGAGGGKGGRGGIETSYINGGSIGATGSSSSLTYGGVGGDHGGSGASTIGTSASGDGGSGGGGGRKLTTTGPVYAPNTLSVGNSMFRSNGGYGGAVGVSGNYYAAGGNANLSWTNGNFNLSTGGGGGGGYGAAGGRGSDGTFGSGNLPGASGGKAIDDSGQTYTFSQGGTVYGGT